MVAALQAFNNFSPQPESKTTGKKSWLTIIYSFLILCILIWVNELVDISHLLFGVQKTPINWQEAISETFVILLVGAFALSRIHYMPSPRAREKKAVPIGKIWLPVAYTFILLSFLIWLDELIDLPHILFQGQPTPINWIEAVGETILILGIGVFAVLLLIRNVTERERAEYRARREKMFSDTLIQVSPVFFVALNQDGQVIMMNDEMLSALGYTPEEVKNVDFINTFILDNEKYKVSLIMEIIKNNDDITRQENHIIAKDGSKLLIEWYGRSICEENGELDFFFGIGTDITERKLFESELEDSREQLRNLNIHSVDVRERERTRIARELHDELGQLLTVLKLDLGFIEKKILDQGIQMDNKISDMSQMVDLTINSLRRIITDLRPSLLDNLGLIAAIEWQAKDFQNRTGIQCDVLVETSNLQADPDLSTTIFRIFQETLTNVTRHSQARNVWVKLDKCDHAINLVVQDNGLGIPAEKITDSKSYGLMGIRERVIFCGGSVEITGRQGQGTTICVTIPLAEGL